MIEPYQAIGLVPTIWGIKRREDIRRNLEHLAHLVRPRPRGCRSLDLPVRLIAIPEGALQGFNDEVLDLDHATFARECAIDIPGPETDELGAPGAAVGRVRDGPGQGAPPRVPRHASSTSASCSTPTARWSCAITRWCRCCRWSTRSRRTTSGTAGSSCTAATLDAFYPVADTEIGRLGVLMANEGSYPENARGLAMNGAEVVYRASYPHPHAGNGLFEVQNRARALDNNFYVIAPTSARTT